MNHLKVILCWLRTGLAAILLISLFFPLNGLHETQALSTSIVISQVYGGGGNSGATYRNDFIELYNLGSSPVDLDLEGWSVQYASASGTSWVSTPLTGTIAPGEYYLVQEAQGSGGTVDLPTPDATGNIAMNATNGKVALVKSTSLLTGSCPLAQTVDFIGYGTANCFEGSAAAPGLTNTTAGLRAGDGCTETDRNNLDFASGSPNPRNSSSPVHVCDGDLPPGVSSTSPVNRAAGVLSNADITIQFSEAVNVAGSWYAISCTASGVHTAVVTGGPDTFVLNPDVDFAPGENCTVTVFAAQVTDQDDVDPPDAMTGNYAFSFTTLAENLLIHDIQGTSHTSPVTGFNVSGVTGIVTALTSNGFYLQEPDADVDADPATSEGIFVFFDASPTVQIGDEVQVSGLVAEFRPGDDAENLSITEITLPVVTVLSSGNALPLPQILGAGGRVPPASVIEDDASGNVETTGIFDPATDGLDFYESLEGMLVRIDDAVAVGPTSPYGELPVVADNGVNAGLRTPRGGIITRPADFNPERILLDDEILRDCSPAQSMPEVNVGAVFSGPVIGVMSYSFGNFKLQAVQDPTVSSNPLVRQITSAVQDAHLAVASFNVENLDPSDSATKFSTLASLIVNHLQSPDLLALEEVQDNSGATNNGVVAADQTLSMLINAIEAAGGPTYDYRQIDPLNNQDGGEPGGNIRVVFLFRTDRGLSFVDRAPGAGQNRSEITVTVEAGSSGPQLSWSPGRIIDVDGVDAFSASRKPLVGEFLYHDQRLFVVANHFSSKGGDQPLFGRYQPPALSSEVKRIQQAQNVHDFVEDILAQGGQANVIVLGDLNDFPFSAPLGVLKGSLLHNLMDRLPEAERYSYVFDGNSQALDHILVSAAIHNRPLTYQSVHINAEFASRASDHDPQLAILDFDLTRVYLPLVSRSP